MAQGAAAFNITDVFDVERFLADIETYRERHNITVRDLTRITGISTSTVTNMRTKGIVSIQSAVVFAYLIDVRLDDYIHADTLGETMASRFTVTPNDRAAAKDGRYASTKQARQAAVKRLVAKYQAEYNQILDEERAKLGLRPLHVTPEPRPEPSAAEWVPEPELSLEDRVDWAWPGERHLAENNGEAVIEVVCRSIKEPAADVDYAGVTK